MVLSNLADRESGIIVKVNGEGAFRKRITEMGFIKGQKVTVIKNAPLKDPIEYSLMGYQVSLRRADASMIEVDPGSGLTINLSEFNNVLYDSDSFPKIENPGKTINIGLVGNPNSGKTSIFNFASNSREHVANYGGVTVDIKLANFQYLGYSFNIFDLPGTYSLSHYSPEELFVRNFIYENHPDVIVNVIDSSNLERNLYLTTQLIDMNLRMVIALNMFDELNSKGDRFDYITFGKMTGIPVVPTVGSKGKGLAQLFNAIISRFKENKEDERHININYGQDMEDSILKIQNALQKPENSTFTNRFYSRFIAVKLLEKDEDMEEKLKLIPGHSEIINITQKEISRLEKLNYEDTSTLVTDARYGFVKGLLKETYIINHSERRKNSEQVDKILTHRLFGLPVFFFFLWLMFHATFTLGQYPMNWIDTGVKWMTGLVDYNMAPGDLKNLISQGIIGGIGGVIIFLPNILILFMFIALMEDTGYMARAAFLMDKVMHKIGLHGKSFIPMVMGFGCNVPAILSTRIIESRNNRIITMLILPFMSCSARLPVYILIIGTFFPNYRGTVLFGLYLFGIILAGSTALLLKRFYFKQEDIPFVMELPPYRLPTIKNTSRHMLSKTGQYLKKIGGVILVASVVIWGLGYYPKNNSTVPSEHDGMEWQNREAPVPNNLQLNAAEPKPLNNNSYLERIGKKIEPAISPLGFDWKIGVSILAGIAGKEIVVSTMGVIYQEDDPDRNTLSLGEKLRSETYANGLPVYTPLTALSFLVFILIYFPCLAVVASVAKESGSIWASVFLIFYTTGLAWIMSFFVYQIGRLIII